MESLKRRICEISYFQITSRGNGIIILLFDLNELEMFEGETILKEFGQSLRFRSEFDDENVKNKIKNKF